MTVPLFDCKYQFIAQSTDDVVGADIIRPAYRSNKFVPDWSEYATMYDYVVGANCVRPTIPCYDFAIVLWEYATFYCTGG